MSDSKISVALTHFSDDELRDISGEVAGQLSKPVVFSRYVQMSARTPEIVSIVILNWVVPALGWDVLKQLLKMTVAAIRKRGREVQKNAWVTVKLNDRTINVYINADNVDQAINAISHKLTVDFLKDIDEGKVVSVEYDGDEVRVHII